MKQILDFIPLILFFITYKFYGVQEAAIILMVATIIQMIILKVVYKKIEKTQLIISLLVVFFSLLTAYFNDLIFLKWKVTIVNGLFAIALLISQFLFKKPLVETLLGKELKLPKPAWQKLNLGWAIFFLICMITNVIVSEFFSDDIWATFKVFGLTIFSLIFTLGTGIFLYPYLKQSNKLEK